MAPTVGEFRDHADTITILIAQGSHAVLLMPDLAASLDRKIERDGRLPIGFTNVRWRLGLVPLLIIEGLRHNRWTNSEQEQGKKAGSERALSDTHDPSPAAQL
jgi:hypothetical protein